MKIVKSVFKALVVGAFIMWVGYSSTIAGLHIFNPPVPPKPIVYDSMNYRGLKDVCFKMWMTKKQGDQSVKEETAKIAEANKRLDKIIADLGRLAKRG